MVQEVGETGLRYILGTTLSGGLWTALQSSEDTQICLSQALSW